MYSNVGWVPDQLLICRPKLSMFTAILMLSIWNHSVTHAWPGVIATNTSSVILARFTTARNAEGPERHEHHWYHHQQQGRSTLLNRIPIVHRHGQ